MSKVTAEGKQSWALKVLFLGALAVIVIAAMVGWAFWQIGSVVF